MEHIKVCSIVTSCILYDRLFVNNLGKIPKVASLSTDPFPFAVECVDSISAPTNLLLGAK